MAFTLIDDPLLHLRETHNALLCNMQARFSASLIRNIEELEQKIILQTIEQLIQWPVLEILFRSLKYTVAIRILKNLSNFPFLPKHQAIQVCWYKQPTSVFKHACTVYTYSNFMLNQLLYCWQMTKPVFVAK